MKRFVLCPDEVFQWRSGEGYGLAPAESLPNIFFLDSVGGENNWKPSVVAFAFVLFICRSSKSVDLIGKQTSFDLPNVKICKGGIICNIYFA